MAVKAANQMTVLDISDGYSAGLTSEAFTFVGGTSGAASGATCTTQAYMFCGSTSCQAVTIGTITNPSGVSASITNNGTATPTITFTLTGTLSAACEATIPISADGVTINKKFSFAVAKTGATGTGVTISTKSVTYQKSSSGTTAPTGEWGDSVPSTSAGEYLWTKTYIKYSDGTETTSYAVSRNGSNGTNGTSPTVSSTTVEYVQSTSGTTVPSSGWGTTLPSANAGQYMWTRTTITYSDGKTAVSTSVTRNGSNGSSGASAVSVVITSDAGNIIKNNSGSITMTAHVYVGTTECTISAAGAVTGATTGTIKWYKGDPNTNSSLTAVATAKTLTVSASDVEDAQVYTCQLE